MSDEAVDEVISRTLCVGTKRDIIRTYEGTSWKLLTQWRGTVLQNTMLSTVLAMALSAATVTLIDTKGSWDLLRRFGPHWSVVADALSKLNNLEKMWQYHLTFSTFVLTFFLGQAFSFWRNAYSLTRQVQGRIQDLLLLLNVHAQRGPGSGGPYSGVTPEANAAIRQIARHLSLCHALFYAGIKCSAPSDTFTAHPLRVLLSERGLQALVTRGILSTSEHAALRSSGLPVSRYYLVILSWVSSRISHEISLGMKRGGGYGGGPGALRGSAGFEQLVLEKCCALRGAMMSIPDELAARIPMAYVHFAQFLVDSLIATTPFALHSSMGPMAFLVTGLVTIFFRGLLELSKTFLDPVGSRRVSTKNFMADIQVDVLLGEINAGARTWVKGVQELPFLTRRGAPGAGSDAEPW